MRRLPGILVVLLLAGNAGCHLLWRLVDADGGAPGTDAAHDSPWPWLPDAPTVWLAGWSHRKPIAIAKPDKSLTDFPLLVSFPAGDADLKARAKPDGGDLAFTAGDGVTRLAHELEVGVGSEGKLVAWVKVPLLGASTPTRIYLYYGNPSPAPGPDPTEVWSNGFLAVWHFHAFGSSPPQLADSTANGNHGAAQNMTGASVVEGQVGKAYHFNGVNQRVIVDRDGVRPSGAFQVSAWFRPDADDTAFGDDVLVGVMGDVGKRGWDLSLDSDGAAGNSCRYVVFRASPDGHHVPDAGWAETCPGRWSQLTGLFEPAGRLALYLDGALDNENLGITFSAVYRPPGIPLVIGAEYMAGAPPDVVSYTGGELDEMRLETPRDAAWIAACHANQREPGKFLAVGHEERAAP